MKKIIILIIISFQFTLAQEKVKPKSIILKTTPSYIFDFDNSFTIGVERFFGSNKSGNFEIGYGNTNQNLLMGVQDWDRNDRYRNLNIFRSKIELKRYSNKNLDFLPKGSYSSVELFGKYLYKRGFLQVNRNVVNFQPEYTEYVLSTQQRSVWGSHIKFGRQFYIFDDNQNKKSRFMMDVYAGVGFRAINNRIDYPNRSETDQFWLDNIYFGKIYTDEGKLAVLSGTLGFKIGYQIR
jgi:hypothetical protein